MGAKALLSNWASRSNLAWLRKFLSPRTPELLRIWQAVGQRWCVETLKISGKELEVGGWVLVPPERRARFDFTWNGEPFAQIKFPVARPDVGSVFHYLAGASESGFVCRAPWNQCEELVTIRCRDRKTGKPFFPNDCPYYYFYPRANEILPSPAQRRRVHGNVLEDNFRVVGSHAASGCPANYYR